MRLCIGSDIPAAAGRTRWTTSRTCRGLRKGVFALRADKHSSCVKHVAGEIFGGLEQRLIIALRRVMRGKMHQFMLRIKLALRLKLSGHCARSWKYES